MLPDEIKNKISKKLVNKLAPSVCLICIFYCGFVFLFCPNEHLRTIPAVPPFLLSLVALSSVHRGKNQFGGFFLIVGVISSIMASMLISGGIRAPGFIGVIPCLLITGSLYDSRKAFFLGISMIILGLIFTRLISLGLLPPHSDPSSIYWVLHYTIWFSVSIMFISVAIELLTDALKESQQATLMETNAKAELDAILDRTPDIIFKLDTSGKVTFISRAVTNYGYSQNQIFGQNMIDFIHPDDRGKIAKSFREKRTEEGALHPVKVRMLSAQSGGASPYKIRILPTQGELPVSAEPKKEFIFLVNLEAIYSNKKSHNNDAESKNLYSGVQGIARDITQEEIYQNELVRFATVIEQTDEEVVITDNQGFIQYVNPSFEKKTRFHKNEVLGQKPSILKSGLHDSGFYSELWRTILSKQIWKGEFKNRCKNGDIVICDTSISPILDSEGEISAFVSIRRDITEKVTVEQQMVQAQKMEAIGTLAGGIAHDFNNILAGILGYSQLVQDDLEESNCDVKTKEKMERVIKASLRAKDLVAQILAFSRSGQEAPSPIKVSLIAKEVLHLLRASLPSFIRIEQSLYSESHVMASPTSIHQILMNLCTNAKDAMVENGGTLRLKLEDHTLDAKAVAGHDDVSPGDFLLIAVKDTGQGMEKEVMERILEPFFTTKLKGQGTGMGLSVVHGIVKSLHGFIDIHSSPGQGAEFRIFLPACDKKTDQNQNIQGVKKTLHDKTSYEGDEKILFVDDETVLAEMNRDSLESYGYDVTIFSDSLDALEHFRQNDKKYHIVISDITMPGMTGDILVEQLRLINPEIPVIICTGFSERINSDKAEMIGVNAMLYKPILAEDMVATIRKVLDGGNHG